MSTFWNYIDIDKHAWDYYTHFFLIDNMILDVSVKFCFRSVFSESTWYVVIGKV